MAIGIVIVNWNAGEQLKNCLCSIIQYHSDVVDKVIIIDNNSSDNSIENILMLETEAFDIIIIRENENLGFGKACNIASQKVTSKYILFLNPDAQIYSGTLKQVVGCMEAYDDIGICGIKLIDSFGNIQRHCTVQPKLKHYFNHATGLSTISSRLFPYIFLKNFNYDSDGDVPHTIGAFYCIRNNLFKELNGFDELFFVYLEDLDLSRRVMQKGYRIRYLASASAYHRGGGTSEKVKALRLFYSLRSRILFGFKHFSLLQAYILVFLTLCVEFITRSLRCLIHFSLSDFHNTCEAYKILIKELPKI
ncbi:glycosyltransferase family 2 protein, partial [Escherichia coli]|nr:glycosyltransferase family 2 protein [Escherichia coli]